MIKSIKGLCTRHFLCLVILTFNSFRAGSQTKDSLEFSIIDVGLGVGTNYGILGAQTVLGYNGSGILLAGGYFMGSLAFEAGLQLSVGSFFLNAGYGTYSIASNNGSSSTEPLLGIILAGGIKYRIPKKKNIFLQLGGSFGTGDGIRTSIGYVPINQVSFVLGAGYQLVRIKRKPK